MADAFDDLSDVYEAMIDWPKRLGNEQGLYRWLFDRVGAKRVLDAACGTGHHAGLFHSWGLEVQGADLSPTMIERCRARLGEASGLRWAVRGFDQPVEQPGSFDVAICVGNSLALAPDMATVERAVAQMLAAVRPGGAVLIHVVSLWRLPDGPCQWQKCLRTNLPQGESLIVKGMHRSGGRGYVDLLVTDLSTQAPALRTECVPFLGLEAADLERIARGCGADKVEFYGNYQRHPYDRAVSQDLIMVAAIAE